MITKEQIAAGRALFAAGRPDVPFACSDCCPHARAQRGLAAMAPALLDEIERLRGDNSSLRDIVLDAADAAQETRHQREIIGEIRERANKLGVPVEKVDMRSRRELLADIERLRDILALLPTADELSALRWTGTSGGYVKRLLGALVCSHCFGRGEEGYPEGSCRRCQTEGAKEAT